MGRFNTIAQNSITLIDLSKSEIRSESTLTGDTSGVFKYTSKELVRYPVLQLYVDADWVGIFKPVGEPEIISTSAPKFKEGDPGTLSVTGENIGDATGNFEFGAICRDGVTFDDQPKFRSISSGSRETVDFRISAFSSEEVLEFTGSCDAYMKETTTQVIDTDTISVSVESRATCPVGQRICDGIDIRECDGFTYKIIQTCPDGQVCQQGQCVTGAGFCGDGICDAGENYVNCRADCEPPPATCGNAVGDSGETCANCPQDVSCPSGQRCTASGECVEDVPAFDPFLLIVGLAVVGILAVAILRVWRRK